MTMTTTTAAPLRQRGRHRNYDTCDAEQVDGPLDEDLQQKMVADIADRIAEQQRRIQRLLRLVCTAAALAASGAIVLAQVSSFLSRSIGEAPASVLGWVLAACMAVVLYTTPDWIPIQSSKEDATTTTPSLSLPVAVSYYPSLTLLAWFIMAVLLWQHRRRYGLAIAASLVLHLVSVAAALYVRSDHAASQKLLSHVAAAKYRYKSL